MFVIDILKIQSHKTETAPTHSIVPLRERSEASDVNSDADVNSDVSGGTDVNSDVGVKAEHR